MSTEQEPVEAKIREAVRLTIAACARAEGHHNGPPWDWSVDEDAIVRQALLPPPEPDKTT